MTGRMLGAIAGWLLLGGTAMAQTESSDAVVRSFAQCRTIADAGPRLDCFDKAAQALEAGVKSKDITIVGRQDVRKAQRSLFGFSIGRIALFGGGRDDPGAQGDPIEEINSTISSARPLANGGAELRLSEDDAVWATTDPMPFLPKPGTPVRIKRGSLGGYFIAVQGQRSARGIRVR